MIPPAEERITTRMTEEFNSGSERLKREFATLSAELARHFSRSEAPKTAGDYLRALLSGVERKTSWQMSGAEGRATPYAIEASAGTITLGREGGPSQTSAACGKGDWDCGVLILDETGFLKKGDKSAGIAHQYGGTDRKPAGRRFCRMGHGGGAHPDRPWALPS